MNNPNSPSLCSNTIKICLVRKFLRKYGLEIRQILKSPEFNGKDFDSFMDVMIKPGTVELFQKYLSYLKSYLKLNDIKNNLRFSENFVRIILSAYTIKYYPDVMNIDKENEISKIMVSRADSLVISMKVLNSIKIGERFSFSSLKCVNKLLNKCLEFGKIFNEWKKLDMEAVICNLAKIYIDLEKEFNDLEKEPKDESSEELLKITEENFEKEKESILKKVKKINSKNGIEIFNKYYIFLNQEIDLNIYNEKLAQAIKENINKAYWDSIKGDMLKIPPDYSKVIELLGECSLLLKQCTPKRLDLIQEIDNFIEIDTLKHYIENDVEVDEYINRMIIFVFTKVEEYQSQNDKVSFDKFKSDFNTLRLQTSTKLSEVLIYFFQGIMPRLHSILQSKYEFEKLINENK